MLTRRAILAGSSAVLISKNANAFKRGNLSTAALQTRFLNLKYGHFIQFGLSTYTNNEDPPASTSINLFNPTSMNMGQILDNTKAMKCQYAVFTGVHRVGAPNYNSATTTYNIMNSSSWAAPTDLIAAFVNGCRARGILPMLYISISDLRFEADNPSGTQAQYLAYKSAQIVELLTNYGPIAGMWIDSLPSEFSGKNAGYPWQSFQDQCNFIRNLQWGCIAINNTQLLNMTGTDICEFEGDTFPGNFVPNGNTFPAEQIQTCYASQEWNWNIFGNPLRSAASLIAETTLYNSRGANYLLGYPPDTTGNIESRMVADMATIGASR